MTGGVDIILFGSGSFAARIALDIAATAAAPVRVCLAGRNAARLDWLRLAGNARAAIFGTPARFTAEPVVLAMPDDAAALMARVRPAVVVQAASPQPSSVISSSGNAWARLVADGGLSATAVLQALFTLRVARAAIRPAVVRLRQSLPHRDHNRGFKPAARAAPRPAGL